MIQNCDLRPWRLFSNLVPFPRTLGHICISFPCTICLLHSVILLVDCYGIVILSCSCCIQVLLQKEMLAYLCALRGTQGCFSVPGELGCLQNKRDAESYRQFLGVPISYLQGCSLCPTEKGACHIPGFEIKLGLTHGPHVVFCAAPGRTWSEVAGRQRWARSHAAPLVHFYVSTNRCCFTACFFACV